MEAWSPTSFFNRRAYGSENLSPIPRKDFCNSIGSEADISSSITGELCFRPPVCWSRPINLPTARRLSAASQATGRRKGDNYLVRCQG